MKLRNIKSALQRLSPEERLNGIGSLLIIIGCFLPWHTIILNYTESRSTASGFSGDMGIIGFVVFLMTLISISFLFEKNIRLKLPTFGHTREKIILFLNSESAFLLLLTSAIFTKQSLDFTNAEIRFGFYFALIGSFISTFAVYAKIRRENKEGLKHEYQDIKENIKAGAGMEEDVKVGMGTRHLDLPEKDPSEKFYYTEEATEPGFTTEEPCITEAADIAEEPQEETGKPEVIRGNTTNQSEQQKYFMRSAGIKIDTDSIRPVEKKENEKIRAESDFYNDL